MLARNAGRLALVIAAILALAACAAPAPPPAAGTTPAVAPTAALSTKAPPTASSTTASGALQPPKAPDTAGAAGNPWPRIQSEGRLVVAVSADYPPFAFYNDQHRLDGFDVALIKAIGEKLNLRVEIQDQAFDGLLDAVQLGAFDTAIAALTVTPERQELVDFTDPYYAGQNAVVAASNAQIGPIDSAQDLAGKRIGVQRGTIYETWGHADLVDAGLIPTENLHVYPDTRLAVADLAAGKVDMVVMDGAPAKVFANQGAVKVVGQALPEQLYAIAVSKTSPELKAALNRALRELQDEGEVSRLGTQYFGLPTDQQAPIPTASAAGESTAAPAPTPATCLDAMMGVDDLNYDDVDMTHIPLVAPKQPVHKGWRVYNSGECAWDPAYTFSFVQGDRMSGHETRLTNVVGPRTTYDVYIDLVAPAEPGLYQGIWQMRDGSGKPFGQRLDATVRVAAGAPVNDGSGTPPGIRTPPANN